MHRTFGKITLAFAVGLLTVPSLVMSAGPYRYHAVTPCRAYDSRTDADGNTPLARGKHNFRLKGTCGVPATAKALTVNATVVGPNSAGWLVLWPSDASEPVVSTLNFIANEPALANGAIVPVDADAPGTSTCDPITETGAPGPNCDTSARIALSLSGSQYNSHLIFDITGYFE